MKRLPAIDATYTLLAGLLDQRMSNAQDRGDHAAMQSVLDKQKIHDAACFVLAWGQFEAEVNKACVKAIAKRKQHVDWQVRRAWDAYPTEEKDLRLRFHDRLALVLDRKSMQSDAYREAIKLYDQRNAIAHGIGLASGVDVSAVIDRLYQFASEFAD